MHRVHRTVNCKYIYNYIFFCGDTGWSRILYIHQIANMYFHPVACISEDLSGMTNLYKLLFLPCSSMSAFHENYAVQQRGQSWYKRNTTVLIIHQLSLSTHHEKFSLQPTKTRKQTSRSVIRNPNGVEQISTWGFKSCRRDAELWETEAVSWLLASGKTIFLCLTTIINVQNISHAGLCAWLLFIEHQLHHIWRSLHASWRLSHSGIRIQTRLKPKASETSDWKLCKNRPTGVEWRLYQKAQLNLLSCLLRFLLPPFTIVFF